MKSLRETTAAVFLRPGKIEIRRIPLPEARPGEVLVRVLCATLCGSDLHTFQGRREQESPCILGHEIVGEVLEVGEGVKLGDPELGPLEAGQRVTWTLAASCGECFFCNRELPQKCAELFKYGHHVLDPSRGPDGGLAEHCVLRRGTTVFRVPEGIPDAVAAGANCATATVCAGLSRAGSAQGKTVWITGGGALGLSAAAVAREQGAEKVLLFEPNPARAELAAEFGATSLKGDLAQATGELHAFTAGRGADLCLEMSGATEAVRACIAGARTGGQIVLVGSVFPSAPVEIHPEQLVRRQLTLHGVHNYTPHDLANALRFLASICNARDRDNSSSDQSVSRKVHPIVKRTDPSTNSPGLASFSRLVERDFPLERAQEAFEFAVSSKAVRVSVSPVSRAKGSA